MFSSAKKHNYRFAISVSFMILSLFGIVGSVYIVRKPKVEERTEAATLDAIELTLEFGQTQTVFDWDSNRCEEWDIPDAPTRFFVDSSGNVQLIATHYEAYRSIGNNINQVNHSCNKVFSSHYDSNPRMYNDKEWLVSPYTLDGQTIYSLVHTEYQGWAHNNCNSSVDFDCWWNSINLAVSSNAGQNYSHSAAPSHNIANSPNEYDPNNNSGPVGFFQPSNIVFKDGYYYSIIRQHNPPDPWGGTIMRTENLADPDSWRFWDGEGFSLPGDRARADFINNNYGYFHLSYNDYLEKYIAVDCQWGATCWLTLSDDLINWTTPQGFTNGNLCIYLSLIQPGDPTRNFEQTSRSPWLYYSVGGTGSCDPNTIGSNRDLKRVRIRISKPEDTGKYELLDMQFNEKKGNMTLDSSFYGNDGVLEGSYSFNQGGDTNYLNFDQGNVRILEDQSLDVSGSISIKTRIRTSVTPAQGVYPIILEKQDNNQVRNYGLYLTPDGYIHFSFSSGGTYSSSTANKKVNDGKWHDIVLTYDNSSGYATYFVDGVSITKKYHGKNIQDGVNNGSVLIGNWFDGDIDYATLYNYITNTCQANCNGKSCGDDDGCGGKCTACPEGSWCDESIWQCKAEEEDNVLLKLGIDITRTEDETNEKIEVKISDNSGTEIVKEFASNSDGKTQTINLGTIDSKEYTIWIKPKKCLSQQITQELNTGLNEIKIDNEFLIGDLQVESYDFINALDFSLFIKYLREQNFEGDVNRDQAVNALDYSIILRSYRLST